MRFLGNYFGAEPAYYGPETQEQYEKRMRKETFGPGLPTDVDTTEYAYKKAWAEQEKKQAEAEAEKWRTAGRAAGRGVSTGLNVLTQAEAGRPVLPSGRSGPRVTAGGGTYGPGYSDPGAPGAPGTTQGFVSRNKWLLISAGGGGVAILLLTTILLLKRKKKEF